MKSLGKMAIPIEIEVQNDPGNMCCMACSSLFFATCDLNMTCFGNTYVLIQYLLSTYSSTLGEFEFFAARLPYPRTKNMNTAFSTFDLTRDTGQVKDWLVKDGFGVSPLVFEHRLFHLATTLSSEIIWGGGALLSPPPYSRWRSAESPVNAGLASGRYQTKNTGNRF